MMKRFRIELKDWSGFVLCAQEVVLHSDMMIALFARQSTGLPKMEPGATVRSSIDTADARAPFSLQVTVL